MKTLDGYFKRCISDAYKSENKNIDWSKIRWFYIIVDKQILFSINTPYVRISRRIEYRINNNVWKNFRLKNDGDYSLDKGDYLERLIQMKCVYNKISVDGQDYYLTRVTNKRKERPPYIFEKLLMTYYNFTFDEFLEKVIGSNDFKFPYNMEWNVYKETFYDAFGIYPEVQINDMSENVKSY